MKIYSLAFLFLFQFPFVCHEALEFTTSFPITDSQQKPNRIKPGVLNIVFKSTDGGQTWQDISEGLSEAGQEDGIQRDDFFADDKGLFLRAGNWIYHNKPNSTAPFWSKEIFSDESWKQVHTGGGVVESNGVLMATSQKGIIRSTDDGENWELVISEGGVGIAIESIKGGFAAITYNTVSKTRRVRTSYDGGKTWTPIDADLPPSPSIASIIQVGEYFFCGHPTGIFRSSDKGKTWKLLLPSIENKVFNLCVSGNVIYAIPRAGGC